MNIAIVQFLKTCRDACRGERLFRQFRPPRQLLLQPLAHRSADVRIKSAPITGGVAERLIAPVLKTGRPKGLVSSNLTPSAPPVEREHERSFHITTLPISVLFNVIC